MQRNLNDVQQVADAYKKDGHKVGTVDIVKAGHYQFKRTAPDGRTFIHSFTPTKTKVETGPTESPHNVDPADFDGHSAAMGEKRGRGRPRGTKSGAR